MIFKDFFYDWFKFFVFKRKNLNIVIKTDVLGSLEAIIASLEKLQKN